MMSSEFTPDWERKLMELIAICSEPPRFKDGRKYSKGRKVVRIRKENKGKRIK